MTPNRAVHQTRARAARAGDCERSVAHVTLRKPAASSFDPKRSFKSVRGSGRLGTSCGAIRPRGNGSSYPLP